VFDTRGEIMDLSRLSAHQREWYETYRDIPIPVAWSDEHHYQLLVTLMGRRDVPSDSYIITEIRESLIDLKEINIRARNSFDIQGIVSMALDENSWWTPMDLLIALTGKERYNLNTLQRTILS
jgi:hypothetical protein